MPDYNAPIRDMIFALSNLAGLDKVTALPGCEDASLDLVTAVIGEAGKLGSEVLAPLNWTGDRFAWKFENGVVIAAPGFKEAYKQFAEGGWSAVPFDPEYGGQGLPWLVATAVQEIVQSANMALGLCPLLTQGAVDALTHHGSDEQKAVYLPKLISGEWTGTMNLTEPQAGSDLAAVRTKAVRNGDHYLITGQKIFITWGDHEMAENIVHLVLARLPDAPAGVKGISLFIVPKYLVKEDGSLGQRNDARCVSLEHKLGIHASPTAVMSFGDDTGAIGYLVGEENRGLEYMFTMMNNARLNVGVQGVAIAERAYQAAVAYAKDRIQGRIPGKPDGAAIINHPDVRRNLLLMRAQTEASRALAYYAAAGLDLARRHPDAEARRLHQAEVDLLIPVVKAWSTDIAVEVASLGIQVHGGMGFIEETGAAQYLRDARILPIYEGTNGIQALDLVGRKTLRDGGEAAKRFIAQIKTVEAELAGQPGDDLAAIRAALSNGVASLEGAVDWLLQNPDAAPSVATPYLRLFGIVAGGWMMARAALAAQQALSQGAEDAPFNEAKLITARFYAEQFLPQAAALLVSIKAGSACILALNEDQF